MGETEVFYEIELKSLLSREIFDNLYKILPQKMKLINEDTIHTTRYRPGDIRLRYSNKIIELIEKEGDVTIICRKETRMPLESMDILNQHHERLRNSNFKADPPWIKHKREFEYKYKGFTYVVCVQDIKDFAYIIEVEHLSDTDDSAIHEPNLKAIIKELGCEPIEPKDFLNRIKRYIEENKK